MDIKELKTRLTVTKEIKLPVSGENFTIKKISGAELIRKGIHIPIMSSSEIAKENVDPERWQKTSEKEKKETVEFNDKLICLGVVMPKITEAYTNNEDSISVDMLCEQDYYFLLKEITALSQGGKELKPFRDEQNSVIN